MKMHLLAPHAYLSFLKRISSKNGAHDFASTRAEQTTQANNFATTDFNICALQLATSVEIMSLQHNGLFRVVSFKRKTGLTMLLEVAQLLAQHASYQFNFRETLH